MPHDRLPKKLVFGELWCGKRLPGGPKKRYKDTLKEAFKSLSINPDTWEEGAQDRSNWCVAIHNGAKNHETERTVAAEKK